ncbi:MAG: hypothetical protein HZB75_01935 [Candidatus Saccharibacteria bacterium]|nr:MAG: hypothetical protein HZB75_01935 [Candidatus Saccharibacteria bacterium]
MTKLIIAIDCDDVIVGSAPYILQHYNTTYGTNLDISDFYSEDLTLWGTTSRAEAIKRVDDYLMTDEYQQLPPFREAIDVARELAKHYELHVVTGRADFLAPATEAMLEQYFPDIFTSVEYTNFFTETPRSKATVCQDIGASILIDDHLHHAKVVAECGVRVLLFGNYSWNQADTLPANIERVESWTDIKKLLIS